VKTIRASGGLLVALLLRAALGAQPHIPVLTAPVNDFANIIDPASERDIEKRIRTLQTATGDVVIVATVRTFQPYYGDIKQYAVKMFENGGKGIGERGKDNGLLIVVAVEDRKVGIEVGYGLEPFVTDGFAGQTIRNDITPSFRQGQYGRGLLAGVTRIVNRIAERRGVSLQDVPRGAPQPPRSFIRFPAAVTLITILLIIILLSRASTRRRRRRYPWGGGPWSGWNSGVGPFGGGSGGFGGGFGGFGGGGGGGGFGGFGGGRSGGGGASGGW
jgi:uncharacterized protein